MVSGAPLLGIFIAEFLQNPEESRSIEYLNVPGLRFSCAVMAIPLPTANPWGSPPGDLKSSKSGFFALPGGEKSSSSRSFKDVVADVSDSQNAGFAFKKSSVKGCPAILFSDEDVVRLVAPF
ncbi:hypothetical protein M5K25_018549 [Dendrobium thyrsiflorum]|uniref:Uncharacterized protein n=1 Tax=Dendrobium thyrsiflorum TaxID=117978 RepID=A0ABD0UQI7_DENTH